MSTSRPAKTRTRRTADQLAAAYQAKANKARAQAAKEARDRGVRTRLAIADALAKAITTRNFHAGDAKNLNFLRWLISSDMDPEQWAMVEAWWKAKGFPHEPAAC